MRLRLALAALIGIDWRVDAHRLQLRRARPCAMVEQIGEDHHIRDIGQPVDGVDRPVNCLLPVHFGVEKSVE